MQPNKHLYTLHYTYNYITQKSVCSVVCISEYTSTLHALHTLHIFYLYIMLCVCIYMCIATRLNVPVYRKFKN